MAQTLKQRDYLFRPRPRRTRPAFAVAVLGIASVLAAGSVQGTGAEEGALAAAQPATMSAALPSR